jgi:hypothetical protein
VLHVVALTLDQAAQMHHNTLSLVALTGKSACGVLHGGKFLDVAFPLTLEFLGNLLLENQGFESIVALLLRAGQAEGETSSIVLLLVDETRKTAILPLMTFDLDLEFGGLLGELFGKRLEFEELE